MGSVAAPRELRLRRTDVYGNSARVVTQAMVGPPVPKLVEYAKEHQIDLVLLATHGRTGMRLEFLSGLRRSQERLREQSREKSD